jgi:hypothetical protein
LFVGSNAVALAGEDGRATIKLNPGAHEVRVTAPSGASAQSVVTVRPEDSGSLKTIALPVGEAKTTVRAPLVIRPEASGTGKRLAVAATVILLLALVAAAYYVIRGPGRPADTTTAQTPQQTAAAGEAALPAPTNPGLPETGIKKAEADSSKAQNDAEKVALEKKLAEAEKKLAGEKKAAEKNATKAEPSAPAAPVPSHPAVPEPPKQQPPPVTNNACVAVSVTGLDGQPAPQMRVAVMQDPDKSATVLNGRTNFNGRWQSCGLTAGQRIKVGVFGPRGALLGGKQAVLSSGQNSVEIQINRQFAPDEEPFERGRKRQRFPRQ